MTWHLAALYDRLTKGHQHAMTSTEAAAAGWMTRRRELLTGTTVITTVDLATVTVPAGTRTMVDSAWPLKNPPATDIVLIYAGGDTPHSWSTVEILAQPARYRWPCWVRSNPGQVNAAHDAAAFILWLEEHDVPKGTCVILDLETAVNPVYVTAFNLALRAAEYKTTKYGSRNYIWKNPKTDGGTFVAAPGPPHMETTGDTVATQWGYFGTYDLSWVKDQATAPLWEIRPPGPFRHVVPAGNTQTLEQVAKARGTTVTHISDVTRAHVSPEHLIVFNAYLAFDAACHAAGLARPAMTPGMIWWSVNK